MAFVKGKRLPGQGGRENGLKGGRPTKAVREAKQLAAEMEKLVIAKSAKKYMEEQLKPVLEAYIASALGSSTGKFKRKPDPATLRHYVGRFVGPAPKSVSLDLAESVEDFYEKIMQGNE